jgi:hypothetical protein
MKTSIAHEYKLCKQFIVSLLYLVLVQGSSYVRGVMQRYIAWTIYRNEGIDTFFSDLCNIHFFLCFETDVAAVTNFKCFLLKEDWWNTLVTMLLVPFLL